VIEKGRGGTVKTKPLAKGEEVEIPDFNQRDIRKYNV